MSFNAASHIFHSPEFRSLVENAMQFFTATPIQPLPPSDSFTGSGVYGLYYIGNNPLYTPIASRNAVDCSQLIYAGKAVPPGWRTSRNADNTAATLYGRLLEHARSIQQADGLTPEDFRCRLMIMNDPESDLITVVESELIRRFTPLWNAVIDGFGNHDPGSGRYNQAKSDWDVLHHGRPWADKLTGASSSREQVEAKIRAALTS